MDKLLCFVKDFSKSIQPMNFSPLSFSPVGEMLVSIVNDKPLTIK